MKNCVLDLIQEKQKAKKMLPLTFKITDLNDSQNEVIKAVYKNNLVCCSAPAGNGKSECIINLALDFLMKGKRVLICSKQDRAVDVVFERLQKLGIEGLAFRFGAKNSNVAMASYILDLIEQKVNLKHNNGNIIKALFKKEEIIEALKTKRANKIKEVLADTDKRKTLITLSKALLQNNKVKREKILKTIDFDCVLDLMPCMCINLQNFGDILPLEKGQWDLVLIDEAAQCTTNIAISAMYRAQKMAVFADRAQLAPLIWLERKKEQAFFTKFDVPQDLQLSWAYTKNSLFDFCSFYAEASVLLDTHYRCVANLMDFPNREFYNNSCKIVKPAKEGAIKKIFIEGAKMETNKHLNYKEGEKAIEILKDIIKDCKKKGEKKSIGLICPFSNMAKYVQTRIMEEIPYNDIEDFEILASSIFSFQGSEKDIVLWLTTITDDSHRAMRTFLENSHTFCVACTRAKEQMIVLYSATKLNGGLLDRYLNSIPA